MSPRNPRERFNIAHKRQTMSPTHPSYQNPSFHRRGVCRLKVIDIPLIKLPDSSAFSCVTGVGSFDIALLTISLPEACSLRTVLCEAWFSFTWLEVIHEAVVQWGCGHGCASPIPTTGLWTAADLRHSGPTRCVGPLEAWLEPEIRDQANQHACKWIELVVSTIWK